MLSIIFLIYLSDVVTGISFASFILACIFSIVAVCFFVDSYVETYGKDKSKEIAMYKKTAWIAAVLMSITIFTPSKDFIKTAVALNVAKDVGEIVSASPIAQKGVTIIENYLNEIIEEQSKKGK